jgi:hypothetical protein
MATGVTIISELCGAKEEAGMVQGVMARQDKSGQFGSEFHSLIFLLAWISFEFGKLIR